MKSRSNTERARRVSSTILHVIANELKAGHLKNPVFEFTTITDVKISGDLHEADVFWTVLDEEDCALVEKAFQKIKGGLRSVVGRNLGSRLTPELNFHYDNLGKTVSLIDDALAKAQLADAHLKKQKEAAQKGGLFAGEQDPYKPKRDPQEIASKFDN